MEVCMRNDDCHTNQWYNRSEFVRYNMATSFLMLINFVIFDSKQDKYHHSKAKENRTTVIRTPKLLPPEIIKNLSALPYKCDLRHDYMLDYKNDESLQFFLDSKVI